MQHKGTQPLETDRLILRRAIRTDAQAMFDNWGSDPAVTKYLSWPTYTSVEPACGVLENWIAGYDNPDFYQWMIVPKDLSQPIGSIGVVSHNDSTAGAEVGYCIGRPWWHQGIMTEALQAVIRYLFDAVGFNRIEAQHDVNNPNSGAVMRKCGMTFEGIHRAAGKNNQGICDLAVYAIVGSQERKHFMADFSPSNEEALVQEIYRRFDESRRLTQTQAGRVEFLTTVKYIEKYLTPGARILDIGAGAGEYSLHFARQGYTVSALELADANISAFRDRLAPADTVDLVQGNALDLSRYADSSFDIVLLLGPLYHLHRDVDKLRCIAEARRVCKPTGKIFFGFISNDIVILTMQQEHPDYLLNGDYDKETFRLEDFPFVFHSPQRCRALLKSAGVKLCHEVASDGLAELLKNTINAMDAASYRQYLRYHFYTCEKPECLGMSNHLLFVGR